MSPREKHIPDHAQRTSVCLTAEDRAAIRWISDVRRNNKSRRTTTNDILVDALWYFLEKTEGKTQNEIRAMVPAIPAAPHSRGDNVKQMPKPKGRG